MEEKAESRRRERILERWILPLEVLGRLFGGTRWTSATPIWKALWTVRRI